MINTFNSAVKFLEGYIPTPDKKHPGQLGLERMKYLVTLLGNPQFTYPTIHVGGTSGKGSTATIIASILATRYKVGLHTSPHLISVTERIKLFSKGPLAEIARSPLIKGEDISNSEFIALLNEMLPVIKKVEESEFGKPSYFEILTALAFLAFVQAKVDIAVIEVGMGGRFDGTNVIKPVVAVLTNVGLDHTEVLGNTVEEIARDKVGIIKPGIEVVTGVKQPSVFKVVNAECRMQNANLSLLTPSTPEESLYAGHPRGVFEAFSYRIKQVTSGGSVFDYFGEHTYRNLKLSLLGLHQVENASLAVRTIESLLERKPEQVKRFLTSFGMTKNNIKAGLKLAFIPGRLEIVSKKPLIVLDGAHNDDKVRALVTAIREIFPQKKVTGIIAIKDDKNAKKILREFLKICQKIIFTKFSLMSDQGVIFSYEPEELLEIAISDFSTPGESLRAAPGVYLALEQAIKEAKEDDLILVTGSLYLVGEISAYFFGRSKK